ncbi:unnamed protein product, partial [Staurois parvus]
QRTPDLIISAAHQCPAVPPTSAHQCHSPVPISATHQWPAVSPISAGQQLCPLVPPVSVASQYYLSVPIIAASSVPISAACPCHLISAHQCCLSVQPHQ